MSRKKEYKYFLMVLHMNSLAPPNKSYFINNLGPNNGPRSAQSFSWLLISKSFGPYLLG
jgi:hypothetical protein